MQPHFTALEFEAFLKEALTDRHFSRQEKRSLSERLNADRADPRMYDVYRGIAFRLARKAVEDTAAGEMLDWLEEILKALRPPPVEAHEAICEAHFSPGDTCPRRIIELIGAARQCLDLCVYTITDDRIAHAVLDAHRRRVVVRVISDCEKCNDLGADVDELRQRGIEVKLNRAGTGRMHHKFCLFDCRVLLTGSYNWTRAAAGSNYENFVVLNAPELVNRFAKEFEELWGQL